MKVRFPVDTNINFRFIKAGEEVDITVEEFKAMRENGLLVDEVKEPVRQEIKQESKSK